MNDYIHTPETASEFETIEWRENEELWRVINFTVFDTGRAHPTPGWHLVDPVHKSIKVPEEAMTTDKETLVNWCRAVRRMGL